MVILLKCCETVFNALILRNVCVKGFDIKGDKIVSQAGFLSKSKYFFLKVIGILDVGSYLFQDGFQMKT